MVHLTLDLLQRGFATHSQPQDIEHLRKMTHLQISGRDIDFIESDALSACRSLTVVYLYDNRLDSIPVFPKSNTINLTHLYLQNNSITRISGLEALKNLLKLFLGGNQITVVEGLEHCSLLEELRIERQHFPPGHRLVFDPQTVAALSQSLQVVDISGNKIASLTPLSQLAQLRELYSTANAVEDFRETGALVESSWRKLEILDLTGNPICQRNKYRERVIYLCNISLRLLDGKEVTEAQRKFVQGWHQAARAKNDEKNTKLPDKVLWSREAKDSKLLSNAAMWQSPQAAAHLQSERMNPEPMLSSNYVIPAMPARNAIRHQQPIAKPIPKGFAQHSFMPTAFGARDLFGSERTHDTAIQDISRRLDMNASLSAKG